MKKYHIVPLALAALLAIPAASRATDLRVGFTLEALTLDPGNHRNRETETIIRNLYDGILTRDARMQIVPELASSWRQLDPLTYEFKIRSGVLFHDGTKMTAEDVKYTFDRLTIDNAIGGQTSPRKDLVGPVKEIQVIDADTVRIVLKEPWPLLPGMLPFQEIVSKASTEKAGPAGMATQENGTGPFKLVEWRKGDAFIMQRFDNYYGGSPDIPPVGKACVDRVIFRIMPENASRIAALLAGEVEIISEVPASAMKRIEANAGTAVMKVNGTRTFYIALNTTKKPFDDVRVRRAANLAIDKKLIIDRVLLGTAIPLNGVMSPDAFGFNAHLPEYKYDPAAAKKLLAEAGYPDGLDVTLDTDGAFKEIAEAVASMLQKVGIRATVAPGEGSTLRTRWAPKGERKGDMFFTSWGNGSLDPADIFVPTLRSNDRGNTAFYANPEVDKLLDAGNIELDRAKRAALYERAQGIVHDDAPWIFLWLPQDIYGVSRRLTNWQPSADSRINLHRACLK